MAEHKVSLVANEGIFRGLSKQNMLFHQCVAELVDNAIAAQRPGTKFHVDIVLAPIQGDNEHLNLYVADNCKGMDIPLLKKALQLGESATTDNRLNEHGFGLKNALATLSGGNGPWSLWSRVPGTPIIASTNGPFRPEMTIRDDIPFPAEEFLPQDISTLVKVTTRVSFFRTVQGRGAPTSDLINLRLWLIEHLGVMYRGYLEQDPKSYDNSGVIVVSMMGDRLQVPPVSVPLGNKHTTYIDLEIGGKVINTQYNHGTLDEVARDKLVRGGKAKYYYQKNIPTQGIDIRLGKRTIATRQFESIWKTADGKTQLSRHNNYNDFLGELLIPELPRGILSTVNNKTDFNLDDPDWGKLFEILNQDPYRPIENIRERSESALREKWTKMLKAVNPDDHVTDEYSVWPTGTKIDVYRKTSDGTVLIYELKVGSASPLNLYQLKMYWDGLVLAGEQPKEAVLLVEDFSNAIEEMANLMNTLPTPKKTKPYNFILEKHKDKGL
ncbi:MAG: ATP-binding protein [Dehalococcoidia bacterium]